MSTQNISANGSFEMPNFRHEHSFDPSYGYTYESLLKISLPQTPHDFESFWKKLYQKTLHVSVSPQILKLVEERKTHVIHETSYTSVDGVTINGWLAIPKNMPPKYGIVFGHGYGGRDSAETDLKFDDAVYIFPCARGLSRSAYHHLEKEGTDKHVVWGIQSRDAYIHGGCVTDYWCAASSILELYPTIGKRLAYMGTSFGGGIGAMLLAWDMRFAAGYLEVPSFGNHPLRLNAPCVGSGQAVREYWLGKPEAIEVLKYFDSATAASFIKIPMFVAAALFDPAVPPFGQFSVYNAMRCEKTLCVVQGGHFCYDNDAAEWSFAQTQGHQFLKSALDRI